MIFKRKEQKAVPWWEPMQEVQHKYSRQLADRLNRQIAGVPVWVVRRYMFVLLLVLTAFNSTVLMHAMRQHWGWKVSPAATGRRQQLPPSIKPWRFDEKLYDSLEKQRPGLADTLKLLESIY
jgi:hypothetical protein